MIKEDFRVALDNKDHCVAIAVDLSKDFDSVSHSLFISLSGKLMALLLPSGKRRKILVPQVTWSAYLRRHVVLPPRQEESTAS